MTVSSTEIRTSRPSTRKQRKATPATYRMATTPLPPRRMGRGTPARLRAACGRLHPRSFNREERLRGGDGEHCIALCELFFLCLSSSRRDSRPHRDQDVPRRHRPYCLCSQGNRRHPHPARDLRPGRGGGRGSAPQRPKPLASPSGRHEAQTPPSSQRPLARASSQLKKAT